MSDENVQSPLISKNVFDEEPLPRKRFRVSSRSTSVGNCPVQRHKVTREERGEKLGKYNGYRGCTVWLTGLSGAGKTTIAFAVEKVLTELGLPTYGLDGDNVRNGLCKNLGFSKEDRCENIRRVAEVAKLFADMGIITLASFISPYRIDRDEARRIHEKDNISFFEVYLNTPLSICEQRDPKKFYEKARAGKLKGFTGIDSDYEAPENADLILKAGEWSESECVRRLLGFLHEKLIIPVEAIRSLDKLLVRELMVLGDEAKQALVREASEIPKIEITDIDKQWLQVLAEGWATPLTGFMRERQYLQCLHHGQIFDLKKKCTEPGSSLEAIDNSDIISSPVNQSVPIVLPITSEQRLSLLTGTDGELCKTVGLTYKGKLLAVLRDPEIYQHRKEERVARQFGITDRRHPTISMIMSSGDWLLGGDIEVLHRITYGDGLDEYRLTPTELRQRFRDEDCDAVFAFQLRNPIHNGHALLMRDTRKQLLKKFKNPMLLLHPLGGWTKDDDVPLKVRIEQHKAVLSEGILDPKWTVLAIFPSPMLYAGPTEVQWHARARIAAGVTTYIVGRDPAGIAHPETGDYLYDPTHGAKVLTMAPGMSALHIIPFRVAAYDKKKGEMDFFDPKRKDDFLFISGTKMRKYARDGIQPPDGFMAPKAWEILSAYYRERNATQK